jgi:hypothetical protein
MSCAKPSQPLLTRGPVKQQQTEHNQECASRSAATAVEEVCVRVETRVAWPRRLLACIPRAALVRLSAHLCLLTLGFPVASRPQDEPLCWICLGGANEDGRGPLFSPCACPRRLHPECLARYQLRCLTRRERESKFCRFCSQQLPDWTAAAARGGEGGGPLPAGRFAIVSIHMGGRVLKVGRCVVAGAGPR